jgi:hypothetical protein
MLMAAGATRIALNVKFFVIRLIGIFISVVPFKAFLLNILGAFVGLSFSRAKTVSGDTCFARHLLSLINT